jgi:fused signal recognition particle receptor
MAEENKGFFKGLLGKLGITKETPPESEAEKPASESTPAEQPAETQSASEWAHNLFQKLAEGPAPQEKPVTAPVPPEAPAEIPVPREVKAPVTPEAPKQAAPVEPAKPVTPVAEPVAVAPPQSAPIVAAEQAKPSFFERLKRSLSKTHESIVGRMDTLLLGKKQIDTDTLEELEEILITADLGV